MISTRGTQWRSSAAAIAARFSFRDQGIRDRLPT